MKTPLLLTALLVGSLAATSAAQEAVLAPVDAGVAPNPVVVAAPMDAGVAAPLLGAGTEVRPGDVSPAARQAAQNASEGPATEPIPPSPATTDEGVSSPLFRTNVIGERPDPNLFGSSAETIPRDQIEALPGGDTQSVADLVTTQPGVHADGVGSNLHIRANDGAVLYVLDGIPMVSPSVGTIGQLLNTVPTRLVQNLEVYTGGFPVEYSYSLGGVVDIRTRRATLDPTAELQLTYGSYNQVDLAANYSQQIGNFGIVASANFLNTDRGLDTPDALGVLNDNRVGGNGFAKLTYDFDARNRLEVFATYEEDKLHMPIDSTMLPLAAAPPGAVRGNDAYGDAPPQFVPYDAQPTDYERTVFAAASYLHEGEVGGQLSLYAREIYENFNCDASRALGASADPGSVCSDFIRDDYHFGVLGKITFPWLPGNSWKAGFQVDQAHSSIGLADYTRLDSSPIGGVDTSAIIYAKDSVATTTAGVYIEDRIEVGRFTFLPGLRFDLQNTTFGANSSLDNVFLYGPSGRLGISYAPADWVVLHAFGGLLWEAPTNYDSAVLFPLVNQTNPGNATVNAEHALAAETWSGEVGVTFHPAHKLALGLTGWGRYMHNWLDHENIGNTPLWAQINWNAGTALGADLFANGEIVRFWDNRFILEGFGNLSTEWADQITIDSNQFLFDPVDIKNSGTDSIQDHVQFWTANVGLLLHDADRWNSLSVRMNYGSGFHTGLNNTLSAPEHTTFDVSISHTFDMPTKPQIVFDVFNLGNDIYAYRLGTGFFGNSQYASPRRFDVRLVLHFG